MVNLNFSGLFLAIVYCFTYSAFLTLAKVIPVIPYFVLTSRGVFNVCLSVLWLAIVWNREIRNDIRMNWKLLVLRSVINGITMSAKVMCVQYMTVADLSIIGQTTPVFVCIIAALFLKERLTFVDSIIILTCFSGVMLVVQPTWAMSTLSHHIGVSHAKPTRNEPSYFAASVAMLAIAFLNAVTSVIMKQLANANVHSSALILSTGMSLIVFSALGLCIRSHKGQIDFDVDFCTEDVWVSVQTILAGFVGYAATLSNFYAVKRIKVSVKSVLCSTLNVLLGFVFTLMLTPEEANLNVWKIFGAILVLASGFLLFAKKEGKCPGFEAKKLTFDVSRSNGEELAEPLLVLFDSDSEEELEHNSRL